MLALRRVWDRPERYASKPLRHSLVTVSESLDSCRDPALRSRLPLILVNAHARPQRFFETFHMHDRPASLTPFWPNGCLGSLRHPYRATWHT
jgi:hypothetical protein